MVGEPSADSTGDEERAGAGSASEGYRTFDHTGDLGLEVWAGTPERLFGLAAEALMAQIAEAGDDGTGVAVDISLTGTDPADLLVHWLNTALLQSALSRAIWTRATVSAWSPRTIEARLQGPLLDSSRHVLLREVKAVSHHDLALELDRPRCWSRIVLDI
jgi:SHS2 domain-containing protein